MSLSRSPKHTNTNPMERGQALVEYALIAVLIGIAFGLAMAASAPVTGNLFNAVVDDLLRQTVIGEVPDRDDFWGTVTGVFEFTPVGGVLPTNTPRPATLTPTDGPSPEPTITYTASPTFTAAPPTLEKTPVDIYKDAPFMDTVEQPNWWRLSRQIALGGSAWVGRFYEGTSLGGDPAIVEGAGWELNYNGVFVPGFPAGNENQFFSARFTRTVEFETDQTLFFRVLADDGVRLFVEGVQVTLTDASGNTDSWSSGQARLFTGWAQIIGGAQRDITVEYYQNSGDAVLRVQMTGPGTNPDDSAVDGSGSENPAGVYACNWGPVVNENDASSEKNLFDDYVDGQAGSGTLCYLEWRGAVRVPPEMTDPELVFWDVWEFDHPGVDGWVEVAEYIPVDPLDVPPVANRDAFVWQAVDLGRGGTANFNWTRNVINLAPLMSGFTSNRLAFRFVIRVPASVTNQERMWLIDDIQFRQKTERTFTDKLWTLDNAEERFDFIHSGNVSNEGEQSGWALVSNNRFGASGYAFHDSVDTTVDSPSQVGGNGGAPFTPYKNLDESPSSDAFPNVRIHYLEFDGWIDLANMPETDSFGNSGIPVVSFYHGYHLGSRTGLYVQYTTDNFTSTPANWITFDSGTLRDISALGEATFTTLQEAIVPLDNLPGNPPKIRIRWAMMVHKLAEVRDGWWIDHIRVGRQEADKWLDYPFYDDVQDMGPLTYWRYTGQWSATTSNGRPSVTGSGTETAISYGSSPDSNYANGQKTALTTRWPIDLYNDTPDKAVIFEPGGGTTGSNSHGTAATAPVLTFYHWRELAPTDQLRVEWRRASETDAQWKPLWVFRYSMGGNNHAVSRTWHYTRVPLYPLLSQLVGAPGTGDLTDDDVLFRFALDADGSSNAPGIFIDDIRLEEDTLQAWKLWPTSQNRTDPATSASLGNGNGSVFFSEPDGVIDGRPYSEDWKMAGLWRSAGYESHAGSGALSFHDSVIGGQDEAPSGAIVLPSIPSDFGDSGWYTPHQTFNVLELDRIIDLRAVDAEDEKPVLYFWTRYHIGTSDSIRVQVTREDTRPAGTIDSGMSGRCQNQAGVLQCYEQERGWVRPNNNNNTWLDVWSAGSNNNPSLSYGWRRIAIDLSPYAYNGSGTSGQRIRLRFVYDALNNSDNYDGWYIDGVEIRYRGANGVTRIAENNYQDNANSMSPWIPEGAWGLDPNIVFSGGGGTATIGVWTGNWWACNQCEAIGAANGATGNDRFKVGADIFLQDPNRPAADQVVSYTNINRSFGSGSPVPGWSQTNYIVSEFRIELTADGVGFQPGQRTFSVRSDDGARMKVEELDASGQPIPNTPLEWNLGINMWSDHSPMTSQGSYTFVFGKRYRITLQYYEKTGDGVIQLTIGDGDYSFSDSPKLGGSLTPDVKALPYANTSLLGNWIIDLTGLQASDVVLLEFQNKYRIDSSAQARIEVSTDGGFTWTSNNLRQDIPGISFSSVNWNGTAGMSATPETSAWQTRLYNLTFYKGRQLLIRFRFDRASTNCIRRDNCNNSDVVGPNGNGVGGNPSLELQNAYYDGWWIENLRVWKP